MLLLWWPLVLCDIIIDLLICMFLLRLTATIYLIKTDVSDGFVISGDVQFVRQLNMNQHHANAIPNYN